MNVAPVFKHPSTDHQEQYIIEFNRSKDLYDTATTPHPDPFSTLVVPWIVCRLDGFLFIVGRNDFQTLREK